MVWINCLSHTVGNPWWVEIVSHIFRHRSWRKISCASLSMKYLAILCLSRWTIRRLVSKVRLTSAFLTNISTRIWVLWSSILSSLHTFLDTNLRAAELVSFYHGALDSGSRWDDDPVSIVLCSAIVYPWFDVCQFLLSVNKLFGAIEGVWANFCNDDSGWVGRVWSAWEYPSSYSAMTRNQATAT